jgi:uncharacterized repeat protein (TIGR01451 family)
MLRSIMSNRRGAWARVAGAVTKRRTRLTVQQLEDRVNPALINSFDRVFTENTTGAITMAANVLLRADPNDPNAASAQAGTGNDLNNNDFNMVAVDVDGVGRASNSSSADLILPAGAEVLWAGLYWGAQSSSSPRNTVSLDTPATPGIQYQTVTAQAPLDSTGVNYSAFQVVTDRVIAGGSGTYTVGNVALTTGGVGNAVTGRYAGWALVVAYRDPNAPARNLSVFNGYAEVRSGDSNITASITGFQAPPAGTVNARLGVVAFEGDRDFTGASLELNGQSVQDAVNQKGNFFSSTISRNGSHVTSKNPNFQNQLGFDADEVIVDGMIPNNSTSAILRFRTSLDQYFPAMAFTEIELFAPQVTLAKTQVDVNGGQLIGGDEIEYTVTVRNVTGDPAIDFILTDPIPANTTYVPGSLVIDDLPRTDAAGDDTGNFDAAGNQVVFRLGTGATATTGGILAIGASSTIKFRVRVNDNNPNPLALIRNQAVASFVGQTTRFNLSAIGPEISATASSQADLFVTKTVDNPTRTVGGTVVFTITLGNNGPSAGNMIEVTDQLPPGLTFLSATPSEGTYDPDTGVWDVGNLPPDKTETLVIRARVDGPGPFTNQACITAVDRPDPDPDNNCATAVVEPSTVDLRVQKVVNSARPNVGDTVTFTVNLSNLSTDTATGVRLADQLPAGLAFVSATPSQGTYVAATGVWNVGSLAGGGAATLTLQARVQNRPPSQPPITNTAAVTDADQFDPVTTNNSASATVTPLKADLAVTKVVSDATPNLGDVISYTITLTNLGDDDATGIVLRDRLPAGLTFVSASPTQGTYVPATGLWTVGDLADGESATLVLIAEVTAVAPGTNVATITAADQFDPVTANNSASAPLNSQQVDLVVGKTVSNARPIQDEVITFSVSVTNRGPNSATNVLLSDVLPAGLTFVSAAPSQGAFDQATGVWTVGTVTTATPATLVIQARVATPAAKLNRASVISLDQPDANPANNAATVSVIPQQADLAVTKSVNNARPNVDKTVQFTITVKNNGKGAATGVQLADVLPPGLTLQLADPSQGSYDPASGTWDVGTLANQAAATLVLTALVTSPAVATNTASVSAVDQFDTVPSNDSDSVTITPRVVDLAVTKTVDNPTPQIGEVVTFTVQVRNNGPDGSQLFHLTDTLPEEYTFVSATTSPGSTFNSATGDWTVFALANGATATLTIRAQVVTPTDAPNVATITGAGSFDPDPSNNSAEVGTRVPQADLVVTKDVNNPTPNVGDTVTFTVTVTNSGTDAATSVQVNDLLPSGLTFAGATPSQGTYASATGVWTVGTLASGASATLQLRAVVVAADERTNTAAATATEFDPTPGNNSASASVTPQQADLAVSKTVSDVLPPVGGIVTYTIILNNNGPSAATGVVVTDPIPAGIVLLNANPPAGTTYDTATNTWSIPSIPAGGELVLTLEAQVNTPEAVQNTAFISDADQYDPFTFNNRDTAEIDELVTDLRVLKTVDNPRPNVGDTVTFTVQLGNLGPNDATNVVLTDSLPPGVTFVSATPSAGTFDSATGQWTVPSLLNGENVFLEIQATVDSPNPQLNAAEVTAHTEIDPNPNNDIAFASFIPQQADLAVSKTVDNPRPNVGDTVTFTITLSNFGKSTATNVALTDLLPTGLTLVSATPSRGVYDSGTGIWTVDEVNSRFAETLVLEATVVAPGELTNTAAVTDVDQFDPVPGNNQDDATITPQSADLEVLKSVDNVAPNVGDVIIFTVTLTNLGLDTATGVALTDLVPAGLTFISAAPDQGTYTAATGLWTVGTVGLNDPVQLDLQARVTGPGTFTNTAAVTDADQVDPVQANNTASASLTPQQADLAVTKAVDNAQPNVGDQVTFTVTVTNNGPDAATGIVINEALPAGLTLVSASTSQGIYSSTIGVWTVGTIASGASATLELVARVSGPQALTNTAAVAAAAQFDPNAANNSASAVIQPQVADVSITKVVDNPRPNVGDTITYTITVTNNGPNTADNVVVTDFVPVTLELISATPTRGAHDPLVGTWNVGTLASGESATLTVMAEVRSSSEATNIAVVRSLQFDPNLGNNVAAARIVPPQADVQVTKRPSARVVTVGQTMFFTIDVSNLGPDTATNVVVSDRLPRGLTFVSANPTQGTYDRASGRWAVGTLASGASARLRIQVRVTSAGSIANVATATQDQFDPVLQNNRALALLVAAIPGKGGFLAN